MSRIAATSFLLLLSAGFVQFAVADDDPRKVRHDMMEEVGDAAKPVGGMLKGDAPFDNERLMKSLKTFLEVSESFGAQFPPGSEGGDKSRAAPEIWTDRAGFDAALEKFHDAVAAAVAADPQTLDAARPVVGPVFNACKNCHDSYRLEKD